MSNNPITIRPDQVGAARQAYAADMAANHPSQKRYANPFDTDDQGNTTFNRWTAADNTSQQNSSTAIETYDDQGRPMTRTVSNAEYAPAIADAYATRGFNRLSEKLRDLQSRYKTDMTQIYKSFS